VTLIKFYVPFEHDLSCLDCSGVTRSLDATWHVLLAC